MKRAGGWRYGWKTTCGPWALGEKWYGQGRDAAHFVCVNVGHGIGAGLVLGGVLYHGASGGAGEFGHITVDPEGPRCNCGNRGCLEVMAAGPALLRRVEEALRAGRPSVLRSLWEAGRLIDGEPITAAAREGDAVAREVLVETGRYLGIGLAGLINLFNPELIIIGGGVAKAWDVLSPPLLATVRERALEPLARRVRIVPSALEEATAVGAATMFLAPMFTLAVG